MSLLAERAGPRLHLAFCQSAGLDPSEVGVQADLARKLGIDKSRYARAVIQGTEVTLDKLLEWMAAWNEAGHGKRIEFALEADDEPRFRIDRRRRSTGASASG